MMKISVKNLIHSDTGTHENQKIKEDIHGLDLMPGIDASEVAGSLTLTKLEESILVEGNLEAKVTLICDRCLENFDHLISFELDREYRIDRKDYSPETLTIDKYLEINLARPIREELILAIPMKNLCKTECKGICPLCGVNLNLEKHKAHKN